MATGASTRRPGDPPRSTPVKVCWIGTSSSQLYLYAAGDQASGGGGEQNGSGGPTAKRVSTRIRQSYLTFAEQLPGNLDIRFVPLVGAGRG